MTQERLVINRSASSSSSSDLDHVLYRILYDFPPFLPMIFMRFSLLPLLSSHTIVPSLGYGLTHSLDFHTLFTPLTQHSHTR